MSRAVVPNRQLATVRQFLKELPDKAAIEWFHKEASAINGKVHESKHLLTDLLNRARTSNPDEECRFPGNFTTLSVFSVRMSYKVCNEVFEARGSRFRLGYRQSNKVLREVYFYDSEGSAADAGEDESFASSDEATPTACTLAVISQRHSNDDPGAQRFWRVSARVLQDWGASQAWLQQGRRRTVLVLAIPKNSPTAGDVGDRIQKALALSGGRGDGVSILIDADEQQASLIDGSTSMALLEDTRRLNQLVKVSRKLAESEGVALTHSAFKKCKHRVSCKPVPKVTFRKLPTYEVLAIETERVRPSVELELSAIRNHPRRVEISEPVDSLTVASHLEREYPDSLVLNWVCHAASRKRDLLEPITASLRLEMALCSPGLNRTNLVKTIRSWLKSFGYLDDAQEMANLLKPLFLGSPSAEGFKAGHKSLLKVLKQLITLHPQTTIICIENYAEADELTKAIYDQLYEHDMKGKLTLVDIKAPAAAQGPLSAEVDGADPADAMLYAASTLGFSFPKLWLRKVMGNGSGEFDEVFQSLMTNRVFRYVGWLGTGEPAQMDDFDVQFARTSQFEQVLALRSREDDLRRIRQLAEHLDRESSIRCKIRAAVILQRLPIREQLDVLGKKAYELRQLVAKRACEIGAPLESQQRLSDAQKILEAIPDELMTESDRLRERVKLSTWKTRLCNAHPDVFGAPTIKAMVKDSEALFWKVLNRYQNPATARDERGEIFNLGRALWSYHEQYSTVDQARHVAEELSPTKVGEDNTIDMEYYHMMAVTLFAAGDFPGCRELAQKGRSLCERNPKADKTTEDSRHDGGVCCKALLAMSRVLDGEDPAAASESATAAWIYSQTDGPKRQALNVVIAYGYRGMFDLLAKRYQAAADWLAENSGHVEHYMDAADSMRWRWFVECVKLSANIGREAAAASDQRKTNMLKVAEHQLKSILQRPFTVDFSPLWRALLGLCCALLGKEKEMNLAFKEAKNECERSGLHAFDRTIDDLAQWAAKLLAKK